MADFTKVIIIYNPQSTGKSQANAKELEKRLKKSLPKLPVETIPTRYAGHGEKLAYKLARGLRHPLIVSSSGDGGYHEVINGVMRAGGKTRRAVCAVLPAGNANDHSRTMHHAPLWQAIQKGKVTKIDLLKVTIEQPGHRQPDVRYAHSYAGLGLTPVIATELNRHSLNAFKEASLVLRMFFKYRPFEIRHKGKKLRFDSLIFANINQMAKFLTLAKKNRPDDGRFEVIAFPHAPKRLLVKKLLLAATIGLKTNHRERKYAFEVIKTMPMQLDGEVMRLAAGSKVQITAAKKALLTIV